MTTYVVGDVQGCMQGLEQLLAHIGFDAKQDALWLAGDLVNRGPDSLAVLRFVKALPHARIVLGNHDLHALALYHGVYPKDKTHTLDALMQAPDAKVLMAWLLTQPLWVEDDDQSVVMTHAGIYPHWSKDQARHLLQEAHEALQQQPLAVLKHMYGNTPIHWDEALVGFERLRFIINAATRMRYLSPTGALDFVTTHAPPGPEGLEPWYWHIHPSFAKTRILFGHWAALRAQPINGQVIALDGGYVWGHEMVAYALESGQFWRLKHRG